jgi:hypothetical protein
MMAAAWLAVPLAAGAAANRALGLPGRPRTTDCSRCVISVADCTCGGEGGGGQWQSTQLVKHGAQA